MSVQESMPGDVARRVELTVAVRDTDAIPKVPDAGEVTEVDGHQVQVMHNGLLIHAGCYQGAWGTEIIRRLHGHHEPQEELVFHTILERLADEGLTRPTMAELGSYWSYYSMWFTHRLAGAEAIMVEPDPQNLEVGRRNFELNDIDGTFVHAAVGGEHQTSMWLPCESDGRVRRVPAVTLGGLLSDHGHDRFDVVLCDTQGAEQAVLEGSRELLRSGAVRFLIVSTHHHIFSGDPLTHQKCLRLLKDLGAHIIAEHSVSESCSGDGLIAVSFDPRDADLAVDVTHVRAKDSVFGEPEYALAQARGWRGPLRRYGGKVVVTALNYLRRERRRQG